MQQFIHEIFNTLGIILSVICWKAINSLLDSVFSFLASWLDYLTASKSAQEKVYLFPISERSRRIQLRQQTRVCRRNHRSFFKRIT